MLHEVTNVRWKQTESVLEAIILEANYIKTHQPKYNVIGKDDKSWNYIVITKDAYPRVETIRQHDLGAVIAGKAKQSRGHKSRQQDRHVPQSSARDDRYSHIFGPYPGLNTKATMRILRKLFHFSTCKPNQKRPCLYYEMGQCLGVCTGEISPAEYRKKVIRPLVTFLSGRKKQLIKRLEIRMRKASKEQSFEEAARLRNQIAALQRIQDIALLNKSFVEEESRDIEVSAFMVSRIEGYDISNLGKTGIVGSMVVFGLGGSIPSEYRKFKIRTLAGQSDVDALEEMIVRRLRHDEWPLPNLFLIDGGKPQVNRVKKILKELNVDIPVVGIAKGPTRKKNEFILGTKQRDVVSWIYKHTKLLIRVRDEAHRFAISYQKQLRKIK
jgi:excinuclease ABC subunit C